MNAFLEKLRPFFLARTRREKVFFTVFLIVLVLVWTTSFLGRLKAFNLERQVVLADARNQAQWLENRESIEAGYEDALALLQTARLPTRNEVMAQIQELIKKYQFNPFTLNPPTTTTRQNLLFHTYTISFPRAEWDKLSAFHDELATALPTVNLEQLTLIADRRNPALINARLRLVAIEFNR
ncbi:MAG: hypothetical protein D6781_08075 [Verrucomicrobia bacterium]|nr:MAG: hypothetical protein D6781_08075 [Verrucomicrobiota bacterium]